MTPKSIQQLHLIKTIDPVRKISPVTTKKSSFFRQSLLRFLELFWVFLYCIRSIRFHCVHIATFICRGLILFLTTLFLSMICILHFITLPWICKEDPRIIRKNK
uniref:Uncharacterized protein n=1 Tax=Chlamydia pneumoniae TaxID=83558 RepID=A0A0F7WUG2_CHLPN|nr:Uncharacterized protein BN1224_DC9_CL_00750 [Chlamydia pneumoniae]